MGWLIAAIVLALLAILPLGVSAVYDEDGGVIAIIAGPFRHCVFPKKKDLGKKDKAQKTKPDKKIDKNDKEKKPDHKKENEGGSVSDFFPFVRLLFDFLSDFRRKLRVKVLKLNILLAGGDPADLAEKYGKTWAAVGGVWPCLERMFVIKKHDVNVACDFVSSETLISARLDITITLGRLIALVVRYGYRVIKEYLSFRKKRNGGTL